MNRPPPLPQRTALNAAGRTGLPSLMQIQPGPMDLTQSAALAHQEREISILKGQVQRLGMRCSAV